MCTHHCKIVRSPKVQLLKDVLTAVCNPDPPAHTPAAPAPTAAPEGAPDAATGHDSLPEDGGGENAADAVHGETMEGEHGDEAMDSEGADDAMGADREDEELDLDAMIDGEALEEVTNEATLLEAEAVASMSLEAASARSLQAYGSMNPDNAETQISMEMTDVGHVPRLPAPLGSFESEKSSALGPGASCTSLVEKTENLSLEDSMCRCICKGSSFGNLGLHSSGGF